jgi:hypothetical protein
MRRGVRRTVISTLLFVPMLVTPAAAGSAKALLTVSARVVANCRLENGQSVCTRGTPKPRIETVVVKTEASPVATAAGGGSEIVVTVNY